MPKRKYATEKEARRAALESRNSFHAREWLRQWRAKNRLRINELGRIRTNKRNHQLKREIVEFSGGKCVRCGYDKCIGALQFHHRDPSTKLFELSSMNLNRHTKEEKELEALKCDLLCANCHAEEHALSCPNDTHSS